MLELLAQQFVNALTIGSIYALIALGYTMVYGVLRLINFAHGELFMLGGYISLGLGAVLMTGPGSPGVLLVITLFVATFFIVGFIGIATERIAYRPLRNSGRLSPVLSSLGLSMALQAFIQILMGPQPMAYPSLFPDVRFNVLGVTISSVQIFIFVLTLLLVMTLEFLIEKTRVGINVRAVAENHVTASLLGVNVNRTVSIIFLLGPGLGAVGGVLYGSYYGIVLPTMGVVLGMKAFTAAILGGIGSIRGAVLGGFALGIFEVIGTSLLPIVTNGALGAEYRDIFAFSVLILVLLFRPSGIFGEQVSEGTSITKREF